MRALRAGLADRHHGLGGRADHHRLPRRRAGARAGRDPHRDHRRQRGRRHVIPEVGPVADPRPDPDPTEWQRLDPRNLLLDPVKALGQFLVPAAHRLRRPQHRRDGGMPWWAVPLVVLGAVAFGVLPWLTTLVAGHRDPVPEAHRPAQQDDLHRSARPGPQRRPRGLAAAPGPRAVQGADRHRRRRRPDHPRRGLPRAGGRAPRPPAGPAQGAAPVARRTAPDAVDGPPRRASSTPGPGRRSWPRSTGRGCASPRSAWPGWSLLAGLVGLLAQFGDDLPFLDQEHLSDGWQWVTSVRASGSWSPFVLVGGLVAWVLVAVTGYVVQWWDMRLTRGPGVAAPDRRALHHPLDQRRGDAGARASRCASRCCCAPSGAASCPRWRPGVGSEGVTRILPPCPRQVCVDVGDDVLAAPGRLTAPLTAHGPVGPPPRARAPGAGRGRPRRAGRAPGRPDRHLLARAGGCRRRCSSSGCRGGAAVAEASYRHLGHALAPDAAAPTHLVVGHAAGGPRAHRAGDRRDHRLGGRPSRGSSAGSGLADLVATTAAGAEKVVVHDVPRDAGRSRLADTATPGVLTAWTA